MQVIHIRDGLVLEARPDGLSLLLRREREPRVVRIFLCEMRCLADAIRAMAILARRGVGATSDDRYPV